MAGTIVYICNPNNPTASITPKNEMSDFLVKLSHATIVLVDEAYHHYVETKEYKSVIPLVKQYHHRNRIRFIKGHDGIKAVSGARSNLCD